MTTNFTQFVNVYLAAFTDQVTSPDRSLWLGELDQEIRYNVQKKGVQEVKLNSGLSYQISVSGLAQADWHVMVVRCIGQGVVQTAGKDASGTVISGATPVYGTAVLPGILFLSTYNLTAAPTILSQADGSVFEVYDATCVEDGG